MLTNSLDVLVPLVPDVVSPAVLIAVSLLIALAALLAPYILLRRLPRIAVVIDSPRWDVDESLAGGAAAIGGTLAAVSADEGGSDTP